MSKEKEVKKEEEEEERKPMIYIDLHGNMVTKIHRLSDCYAINFGTVGDNIQLRIYIPLKRGLGELIKQLQKAGKEKR